MTNVSHQGQQGATGCNQRHLCEGVSRAAKIAPGAPATVQVFTRSTNAFTKEEEASSLLLTIETANTSNHIGEGIYFIDISTENRGISKDMPFDKQFFAIPLSSV